MTPAKRQREYRRRVQYARCLWQVETGLSQTLSRPHYGLCRPQFHAL